MNIRPVLMAAVDDRNGRSYKRTNDRQLFPKRYIATDQSEDANCQEGDGRKERKPRYHDNPFDSPVNSPSPPPGPIFPPGVKPLLAHAHWQLASRA